MPINLGAGSISAVRLGAQVITRVYSGVDIVFEAGGPPPQNFLLDDFPGAIAAYSIRRLSSLYTGPLFRVRRSSDNLEQDIPFDGNGDLDTANLLTFVGANDGFVSAWYDQSGLSRNTFQPSQTSQPQIVTLGVIEVSGTRPGLRWSGFGNSLDSASFSFIQPFTYFGAYEVFTGSAGHIWSDIDNSTRIQLPANSTGRRPRSNAQLTLGGVGAARELGTYAFDGTNSEIFLDGISRLIGNAGTLGVDSGLRIGQNSSAGAALNGFQQELIFYESDQRTNRVGIETNINTYYGIF